MLTVFRPSARQFTSVSAAHLVEKHRLLSQMAAGNQAQAPPPTQVNKWVAEIC